MPFNTSSATRAAKKVHGKRRTIESLGDVVDAINDEIIRVRGQRSQGDLKAPKIAQLLLKRYIAAGQRELLEDLAEGAMVVGDKLAELYWRRPTVIVAVQEVIDDLIESTRDHEDSELVSSEEPEAAQEEDVPGLSSYESFYWKISVMERTYSVASLKGLPHVSLPAAPATATPPKEAAKSTKKSWSESVMDFINNHLDNGGGELSEFKLWELERMAA